MKITKFFDLKRQLNKPEYWFNPKQLLKRLTYSNQSRQNLCIQLPPSNKDFFLNENEVIGRSIMTMGVYDLIVAETIKRLINPGDHFWDVGANIGYFSRLAAEWGAQTTSFEPHPKIFNKLSNNLKAFTHAQIYQKALSDKKGRFSLYIPKSFDNNEGIASLEPIEDSEKVDVETDRMESHTSQMIRLLKIDVEGHELHVLKGANQLLEEKKIQNILFEDFNGAQSPSIQYLKEKGYNTFGLLKTVTGPRLLELHELNQQPSYEPPNFIATPAEHELKALFAKSGWGFYK